VPPKLVSIAAACLIVAGVAAAREPAPASAPIDRGHRLFDVHCARCHGIGGGGGEGPLLARPVLRYAPDDAALVEVIQEGIPRTAMIGTFALSDAEAIDVAAYVRSLAHPRLGRGGLGRVEQEPVTGDAERGRVLYDEQACGACHIVAGEGRGIGPELTTIGETRGAEYLRQSLVDATAVVAEDYRVVSVRGADGATVRGVRVNEDDFSILVRDADARLHSIVLEGATLRKEMGESLMPGYAKRLSSAEIEDLVAYLVSLRGDR
jgi:putative heme-binding domain-containing protein